MSTDMNRRCQQEVALRVITVKNHLKCCTFFSTILFSWIFEYLSRILVPMSAMKFTSNKPFPQSLPPLWGNYLTGNSPQRGEKQQGSSCWTWIMNWSSLHSGIEITGHLDGSHSVQTQRYLEMCTEWDVTKWKSVAQFSEFSGN